MASITTRAGKGSPLTHAEVDANFNNLNSGKLDISAAPAGSVTVDSSGRVGINSTSPGARLDILGTTPSLHISDNTGGTPDYRGYTLDFSTRQPTGGINFLISSPSAFLDLYAGGSAANLGGWDGQIRFFTGGTNSYGTERARIDSSGRLLVGTSSSRLYTSLGDLKLQVEGTYWANSSIGLTNNQATVDGAYIALAKTRGTSVGSLTSVQSGDLLGSIWFQGADGTALVRGGVIECVVDGTPGTSDMPGRLVFSTTADGASTPTERMRIANDGQTSFFGSGNLATVISSSKAAGTTDYTIQARYGASGNTGGTASFQVFTNGNAQNTNNSYGAISDIKLKENIVDATSQWSDIKSLQVRKYNFKEGQTHTQIGLVAQEVELVSPGLVTESPDRDEDGNDLGTVTKSVNYSVLYMKAVKALQEAMERIETLEAKVAALEASS